LQRRQSKRPLQRNIIIPARQAANRLWSMTSAAIPATNNPALPMSAACAVFFLAHANEKHEWQFQLLCIGAQFTPPIGVEG
jgi:hypothetical protein